MFRMPIRFKIWMILASITNSPGCAIGHPVSQWFEIGQSSHRSCACAVAPCDGSKIGFRKLDNVDRIALPSEKVNLGCVGTVVVDQDAHPRFETQSCLKIGN